LAACTCLTLDHDRIVAKAVKAAARGISNGDLSVVRNGGWELWFRNRLLVTLERDRTLGSMGFTERPSGGRRRADLLFHCLKCPATTLALEVKTNFVTQPNDVRKAVVLGRDQLHKHIENAVPSVLICVVTHLWFAAEGPYSTTHNRVLERTKYKHFRQRSASAREDWTVIDDALPTEDRLVERRLVSGNARALIAIWAARITSTRFPRFIHQD